MLLNKGGFEQKSPLFLHYFYLGLNLYILINPKTYRNT